MTKFKITFISLLLAILSSGNAFAQSSTEYIDSLVMVRAMLLERNAEGTAATDINLMTLDGEDTSLYQFESELTLLYLYHPDCYTCIATIQYLNENPNFKKLIKNKKLKVLAVDLTPDMISISENIYPPKDWTLCFNYDASINNRLVYYIEDFPSIYLLDKDKKVLLKNPQAHELVDYLEQYN